MPLDPQVRDYLQQAAADTSPPIKALTPAQARKQMSIKSAMLGAPQPVGRIEDRTIDGPGGPLAVRLYFPKVEPRAGGLPVLAFFHGGGWVIGGIDTHDGLCRAIANESGAIVASVDYRLAPEHPFPAAAEDAFASVKWLHREASGFGGDPSKIGVGGDSAGGNLATVAAIMCRDQGGPPLACQFLAYPATDCDLDTQSYRDCAEGFGLNRAEMEWFWGHYVADPAGRAQPLASPLRADDLSGLPPAFVMTAEYDVLRDEGERYADRLARAGVPVRLERYDGMIHGFLRRFMFFEGGRRALADLGRELRRTMGSVGEA